MHEVNESISYAIDWLKGWEIEIPLDIAFSAIDSGIKDFEYFKTAEQFDSRLTNLVKALYKGTISASSFVDSLAALISRQITLAHREAWTDEGDGGNFPDYLTASIDEFASAQFAFVDQYARDIVDAAIDNAPIDPLLARVQLWANRYNEAYNKAVLLISSQNGGKLEWVLGATEEHCASCSALNGIVAYATEWAEAGVQPQNAPNDKLECDGWHCDCGLSSTDKRRTKNALERIKAATK